MDPWVEVSFKVLSFILGGIVVAAFSLYIKRPNSMPFGSYLLIAVLASLVQLFISYQLYEPMIFALFVVSDIVIVLYLILARYLKRLQGK